MRQYIKVIGVILVLAFLSTPLFVKAEFCGLLRQSTAVNVRMGPFLDQTDGITSETGLSMTQVDVLVSKNGGPFSTKSRAGALVHDSNGYYWMALGSVDTNTVGRLYIVIRKSGALIVTQTYQVISQANYDTYFD